jgi:hypothetical protein
MTMYIRSSVFIVMAMVTVVGCLLSVNPDTSVEAGVIVWLPNDIEGSYGTKGYMGKQEREWLPADTTYLKMTYKESGLGEKEARYRALNATLIVAGSDSRSLHRPQVCLTAQGWEIGEREVVQLETKGGELKVMNYHLSQFVRNEDGSIKLDGNGEKLSQRAFYCYWWVGPNDTTHSDEKRIWKSAWNSILTGKNERWAYPSVISMIDERMGDEGVLEARNRVFGFIKEYSPTFQKSLGAVDREGAEELEEL